MRRGQSLGIGRCMEHADCWISYFEIIEGLSDLSVDSRIAVCPSFVHLDLVCQILKSSAED